VRINNYTQRLYRAGLLGLAALLVNASLLVLWGPELKLHLGNIFIFCSIIALGAWGGLVSVLVGAFPFSVYADAPGELLRFLVLAITVGLVTRKTNRVNGTSLVMLVWLCALGPVSEFVLTDDQRLLLPVQDTWILWSDMICATIAGLLLLSASIWCRLTETPRHVPLTALSSHVISAIAIGTLCLGYSWSTPAWMTTWNLLLWVATIQFASVALGYSVAQFLLDNFHSLSRDTLRKREDTSTFSGLSTEHWRRKNKAERRDSTKGMWRRPQQVPDTASMIDEESHNEEPSKEGVCVIDIRGTVYFANKQFIEMVGVKVDDYPGKRIDALGISEAWVKPFLTMAEETLATGPRFQELKLNSLPNKLRYFEISARVSSPATDMLSNGEPDTVILCIRDISERRTFESGVVKAQRLESVGALMNGLAHEFNNSLAAITAKASIATSDSFNPSHAQKALKEIVEFAKYSAQTVQGLLDFTDGSAGKVQKVNIVKLINDKLVILRKLVGANYDLTYSTSSVVDEERIGSWCNPVLFGQLLTNLILNAREAYTEGTGEIKIRIDTESISQEVTSLPIGVKPGKFSRLRVEHHGIGMNRNVIAKAFDPTTSDHGTGLGLSIVFTIVRAHDGFLTAESHPTKGTIITVYLPLVELEAEELNKNVEIAPVLKVNGTEPPPPPTGQRILVVEDEPNVRELTAYMLTELGYKVVSCDNGKDAIELAKQEPFDLILVDYVIPRLAGSDLIDQLKSLNKDCKTLVMTGYGSSVADEIDATIINKPFDMDTLSAAIKKAFSTSQEIEPVHSQLHR